MLRQFIEEFEKIAAVAAMEDEGEEVRPFEVGVTGTFWHEFNSQNAFWNWAHNLVYPFPTYAL